jgi:hypothetical protein
VDLTVHVVYSHRRPGRQIGTIGETDPKESIAGIENAVQGVVVELFPKIRFGRAEMCLCTLRVALSSSLGREPRPILSFPPYASRGIRGSLQVSGVFALKITVP